jgi:ribosomal protein S27E
MTTSFKSKSFKTIPCNECGDPTKVDEKATGVICWRCTISLNNPSAKLADEDVEKKVKKS